MDSPVIHAAETWHASYNRAGLPGVICALAFSAGPGGCVTTCGRNSAVILHINVCLFIAVKIRFFVIFREEFSLRFTKTGLKIEDNIKEIIAIGMGVLKKTG